MNRIHLVQFFFFFCLKHFPNFSSTLTKNYRVNYFIKLRSNVKILRV